MHVVWAGHRWWLLLIALLVVGCDKPYKSSLSEEQIRRLTAKQKPLADVSLSVCGDTITYETLYNAPMQVGGRRVALGPYVSFVASSSDLETFKAKVRTQVRSAVEGLIYDTILYQQAKREGGKQLNEGVEKTAQMLWRQFVLENGGDEAAAEDVLKKQGLDRKQFNEHRKREILTYYLVSLRLKSDQPVSHRELVDWYSHTKDRQFAIKPRLTFRTIQIQSSMLQIIDPNVERLQQARQVASELMDRLAQGEDFARLASEYSHDPMASSGGFWASVDPCSLQGPYDRIAWIAMGLDPGQIKGPIEIGTDVFIVKLEHKQEPGYLPLEQVQGQVREQILRERRRKAQEQLQAELAERAKVGQIDDFLEAFLSEVYRRSQVSP